MSFHIIDPDEYVGVSTHTPCRSCGGDMRKCDGRCSGSSSFGMVRRPQAEIDAIKAKKRREHEDKILAEAAVIRAMRGDNQ